MTELLCKCGLIAGMLLASGCIRPGGGSRESLLHTDRQLSEAVRGDDINLIAGFWTEDGTLFTGGRPTIAGRENFRQFVAQNRSKPGFAMTWEVAEAVVSDGGDLGYVLGPYQLTVPTPEGGLKTLKGNFVSIWRHEDGQWRCARKFNSPLPAPGS